MRMKELVDVIEKYPVVACGVEKGKVIRHHLLDNGDVVELVLAPPPKN